ncbi:TPA: single-stranded DNA-binding protein [Clostridium botulinum]|nr:single-stranded DNA-binding protein [Clostridium botulinum]
MEKRFYSFIGLEKLEKGKAVGVVEGLVCKDLTTRDANGKKVVNTSIVSNNVSKKIAYGIQVELEEKDSTFIQIVAWENLADRFLKVVKKGAVIEVFGTLQEKSYTSKNGGEMKYLELTAREFKINKFPKKDESSESQDQPIEELGDIPF